MKGRKRHRLVDTTGLGLQVRVHPANVPDGGGAHQLLAAIADRAARFARLHQIWVDSA